MPAVNILVNVYLMVSLEPGIWAKLLVWLAGKFLLLFPILIKFSAGYAIYFFYGTTHSSEFKKSTKYLAGEMVSVFFESEK